MVSYGIVVFTIRDRQLGEGSPRMSVRRRRSSVDPPAGASEAEVVWSALISSCLGKVKKATSDHQQKRALRGGGRGWSVLARSRALATKED